MDYSKEEMPDHFHQIVKAIAEILPVGENNIVIGMLILAGILFVIVAFLAWKVFNKRKGNNMVNSEDEKKHPETSSPEPVDAQTPKSDDGSSLPENTNICAEPETSPVGDSGSVSPSSPLNTVDVAKPEDTKLAIAIYYKTCKPVAEDVRKGMIEPFFKERIGKINIPFGTVGQHYDPVLLDFNAGGTELSVLAENIEITKCGLSKSLKELGFSCKKDGTSILFSGEPKKNFIGDLFFVPVYEGCELTKIDDYPSKPFRVNPDPRSLWKNEPVVWDNIGYKNDPEKNDGYDFVLENAPVKKTGVIGMVGNALGSMSSKPVLPNTIEMEIIAASKRGRSHEHNATPRDDCFYYEPNGESGSDESGWHFVAVADGAGSAKYSREGARLACQTVVQKLRELFKTKVNPPGEPFAKTVTFAKNKKAFMESMAGNQSWDMELQQRISGETGLDQIFIDAVQCAIEAIDNAAKQRKNDRDEDVSIRNYHTTLLCAAFKYFGPKKNAQDGMSGWFIASYWVGDGGAAIVRWNGEDRSLVLGEPDGGEHAGEARFLTMKDESSESAIKKRLRFSFCDTFGALLLVTDGVTDPFLPSEAAVVDGGRWLEFYEKKFRETCDEEPNGCKDVFAKDKSAKDKSASLLKWLEFWSKGNHDDRTMLIVKQK